MIRTKEITQLALDDIEKWLSKYSYEEIEFLEDKNYIFVKANKSYDGHFFNVDIEYNDVTKIIHISVHCLTYVPKDKWIFCLKLLNYVGFFEQRAKYTLCPYNHRIKCSTSHSLYKSQVSIGQLIEIQASCSIENLSFTYHTIENDDLRISGIHPIRFYNDFLN